jgi:lipopolysaccharide biosynthesis protein
MRDSRIIAFYLPQFHPIPENDAWWGKGFTEWTNVAKAKPLFRGHYQPRIPADLGFYDLRLPETRMAQAEMAREHGIEGFCYWHYWFAGRQLLERPFSEVLRSGEPRFPFCLAWANGSWTGIWHGEPDRVLIEQTYPGIEDDEAHFYAVLEAFGDARYMTIEGKPIFVVYEPRTLPEPRRFTDGWRELALRSGLKGIYFIGVARRSWVPETHGFDASTLSNPGIVLSKLNWVGRVNRLCQKRFGRDLTSVERRIRRLASRPKVYLYDSAIRHALPPLATDFIQYPCAIPNWDNTPRSDVNGVVFHRSSPESFRIHLTRALAQVIHREPEHRLVFIKSWNEWAEGNYLEPDQRFGRAYLQAIKDAMAGVGTAEVGTC